MYLKSLQHFCDIYHKQNFATHSVSVHPSDIPHFATFNHTHNIANFTIQKVLLNTLRVIGNRNLALFGALHVAMEYGSQTSSQKFYKTFRWWKYRKLQCALARKVVKGLMEKEVSQKVSQCHLIYHGLF